MELIEKFPVVSSFTIFIFGIVTAMIGGYLSFATQLAYIRGQLGEILKFNKGLSDIVEKSAKIDNALDTFDNLHSRVSYLEQKLLNGGSYGRSS